MVGSKIGNGDPIKRNGEPPDDHFADDEADFSELDYGEIQEKVSSNITDLDYDLIMKPEDLELEEILSDQ